MNIFNIGIPHNEDDPIPGCLLNVFIANNVLKSR